MRNGSGSRGESASPDERRLAAWDGAETGSWKSCSTSLEVFRRRSRRSRTTTSAMLSKRPRTPPMTASRRGSEKMASGAGPRFGQISALPVCKRGELLQLELPVAQVLSVGRLTLTGGKGKEAAGHETLGLSKLVLVGRPPEGDVLSHISVRQRRSERRAVVSGRDLQHIRLGIRPTATSACTRLRLTCSFFPTRSATVGSCTRLRFVAACRVGSCTLPRIELPEQLLIEIRVLEQEGRAGRVPRGLALGDEICAYRGDSGHKQDEPRVAPERQEQRGQISL